MLRRRSPEKGPPGLHQIGTQEVEILVDEEILLLRPEGDLDVIVLLAEALHEALDRVPKGLDGAQERRLPVQRRPGVGVEGRGDAQRRPLGMALDEGRTRGIPGGVSPGFEGAPEPPRRKARGVGFPHDQVFPGKGHDGLSHAGAFEKGVVLFRRAPREGLEPVGEVGRAAGHGPFLHGVGHIARDGGIQGRAAGDGRQKFFRRALGQILSDGRRVEDIFPVRGDVGACRGAGPRNGTGGDRVDRVDPVVAAHCTFSC